MPNESRPKRAWLWLAAVLCIGLAATPTPLAAQSAADQDSAETETQQFEDWTLRCRPASETQPRTCRIHQQVVAADSGKPVLQFLAGRFGPEKVLGAVIFVPIGVRLPPGLGIQVDERPSRSASAGFAGFSLRNRTAGPRRRFRAPRRSPPVRPATFTPPAGRTPASAVSSKPRAFFLDPRFRRHERRLTANSVSAPGSGYRSSSTSVWNYLPRYDRDPVASSGNSPGNGRQRG